MDKEKNNISHIAFIMDGNGRWAKKRKMDRSKGHEKGVSIIKDIVMSCFEDYKIKVASLFTFSTENWNRPKKEISILFKLLKDFFKKEINFFYSKGVKVIVSGDLEDRRIPKDVKKVIIDSMNKTKECTNNIFNILFNYGSKNEIRLACKKIAIDYSQNKINLDDIENRFNDYLYTKEFSNIDLLIRTSGEQRLSNCLLYQLAYAELIFNDTYWPDYNLDLLKKDINTYLNRERRFGKISS